MDVLRLKELFEKSADRYAEAKAIGTTYQTMYNIIYKGSLCKVDLLQRIAKYYNKPIGYFFGEEEQKEIVAVCDIPTKGSVPYYENLPVSAGQAELIHITEGETPSGYIRLPGVNAIAAFPVVGCSMEPEIKAGDFVAITPVDNLERVDPDKTYMIVTEDDRMIKHLMIDNEDESILWAVSPNYPKFRLRKRELKAVYRINFVGKVL